MRLLSGRSPVGLAVIITTAVAGACARSSTSTSRELSCRSSRVAPVDGELQLEPEALQFGDTFVGTAKSQTFTLHNRGAASLTVQVSVDDGPFTVSPDEVVLSAGLDALVQVTFTPRSLGVATGTVTVGGRTVALDGAGVVAPECNAGPCEVASVDAEAGCVVTARPDDSPCSDANTCVSAGVCRAGTCVSSQTTCDDGNACTVDLCGQQGCVHEPVQCPASSDPCLVPICDPRTGCALTQAADGASCGENDCVTAHVCIAGACVQRTAPEGSTCGTTSVCQSPGQCRQNTCAPAAPLELWRYVPPTGFTFGSGAVFDSAGNAYLALGTNQYPADGGYDLSRLVSLSPSGTVRFDVDLSIESPQLETVTTVLVDDATKRVLLSGRSWRTHPENQRIVVAQARDATCC
jgi:hypothetical protein